MESETENASCLREYSIHVLPKHCCAFNVSWLFRPSSGDTFTRTLHIIARALHRPPRSRTPCLARSRRGCALAPPRSLTRTLTLHTRTHTQCISRFSWSFDQICQSNVTLFTSRSCLRTRHKATKYVSVIVVLCVRFLLHFRVPHACVFFF